MGAEQSRSREEKDHGEGVKSYLDWRQDVRGFGQMLLFGDWKSTRVYEYNGRAYSSLEEARQARREEQEKLAADYITQGDSVSDLALRINKYNRALELQPDNYLIRCRMYECMAQISINEGDYQKAIEQCDEGLKAYPEGETARRLKAQALIAQGDNEENLEAKINKYQQALELQPDNHLIRCHMYECMAQISINEGDYQRAIDECDAGLNAYSEGETARRLKAQALVLSIISGGINENNIEPLRKASEQLKEIIDSGHKEGDHVTTMLTAEHHIAIYDLNKKMKETDNPDDLDKLKKAAINLCKETIKLLDALNIKSDSIKEELEKLQVDLRTRRLAEQKEERISLSGIPGKAKRVISLAEKVQTTALEEKLFLEKGNASILREYFTCDAFETYYTSGMNRSLSLRLKLSVADSKIKLLPSKVINIEKKNNNLKSMISVFTETLHSGKVAILPFILKKENAISHWVGVIGEVVETKLLIFYLDSENNSIPIEFEEMCVSQFSILNPKIKVILRQIKVEQQRYNNCGYELIENIVNYLTGKRVEQEYAIQLHSELWEQELIMEDISQRRKIANINDESQLSWSDRIMKQRKENEVEKYDNVCYGK